MADLRIVNFHSPVENLSGPYKAGLSYLLGIFSHAISPNGNRFYTHNRHR
nr:MAG TPA: hypothetical protein [Caudoviricetes sp.]